MIAPNEVLLGDFRAAVTLLDGYSSTLALRRDGDMAVVRAQMRIGLAVHLVQHLLLLGH